MFGKKKEKEKKPKEIEKNVELNKKPEKLKKNTGLKFIRFLLWAILIFIFIRGTATLVRPDPINEMQKSQKEFIAKVDIQSAIQSRVFSFAESFAKEYYTHTNKQDENYRKRLSEFMQEDLIKNIKSTSDITAIETKAYDIEKYSDSQYDVFVWLNVQYKISDGEQVKNTKGKVYLKIPIAYNNDNFVVEDMPNVVSAPNKGNIEINEFFGSEAEDGLKKEISNVLNQFFKAYYELPQTQIDYFLDSDIEQEINGVNGRFKFNKIDKVNIYYDTNKRDSFIAIVSLKVNDSIDKSLLDQKYNLKVVKKEDKYYINQMNVRTVNIKEDKEK